MHKEDSRHPASCSFNTGGYYPAENLVDASNVDECDEDSISSFLIPAIVINYLKGEFT